MDFRKLRGVWDDYVCNESLVRKYGVIYTWAAPAQCQHQSSPPGLLPNPPSAPWPQILGRWLPQAAPARSHSLTPHLTDCLENLISSLRQGSYDLFIILKLNASVAAQKKSMAEKNVLNMILTFRNITRISVDIKAKCYLMLILTSPVSVRLALNNVQCNICKYLELDQWI